jgi:hypothetical protein
VSVSSGASAIAASLTAIFPLTVVSVRCLTLNVALV